MRQTFFAAAALLLLAACAGGSSDQAEAQADTLDNAAQQSTPEAAAVLENRADAIRADGAVGAPGDPNSSVQQAMENAGAAQDAEQAPAPGPKPTITPDR